MMVVIGMYEFCVGFGNNFGKDGFMWWGWWFVFDDMIVVVLDCIFFSLWCGVWYYYGVGNVVLISCIGKVGFVIVGWVCCNIFFCLFVV